MNVEEGELRPQLLDRFGLGVEVRAPREAGERAEIVRRRLAFEREPEAFVARYAEQERALAERIAAARARVESVRLPERELLRIAGACARLGVDGVRGDLVTARAARAFAALDGAEEVDKGHVRRAAELALAHRRRRDPLDGRRADPDDIARARHDDAPTDRPPDDDGPASDPPRGDDGAAENGRAGGASTRPASAGASAGASANAGAGTSAEGAPADADAQAPAGASAREGAKANAGAAGDAGTQAQAQAPAQRQVAPAGARLPAAALRLTGAGGGPLGRRARTAGGQAGAIDSRAARAGEQDVAIVATLCARLLGAPGEHVRTAIRAGGEGALLCLVVDASGSMGARRRLARVKGALLGVLRDAYARRDRVGLIAFRGQAAQTLVAPGTPLERAAEAVRALPAGGRTPLAAGLHAAAEMIAGERLREPGRRAIAVVLTDGRAQDANGEVPRAAARLARAADAVHVIDTEDGRVRLGLAAAIARAADAGLHRLANDDFY